MTVSGDMRTAEAVASRVPISVNQQFVGMFDSGDDSGPLGPRYHLVDGWRVTGKVHIPALQGALDDVVARHEALRTLLVKDEDGSWYQEIHPPCPADLTIIDLTASGLDERWDVAEQFVLDAEAGKVSARAVPLLRCVLGRFDDDDAVLVLMAHHTATDGWSMQVIMRDLATLYARRRGAPAAALPAARQYREHVAQEKAAEQSAELIASLNYWRERLRGGRIVTVTTDWPRSAALTSATHVHRFLLDTAGAKTATLARETRGTPFMVLLAAFNVLTCRLADVTDIVVPTFTLGRDGETFVDSVGSFFNFLPVRTSIEGYETFRDAVLLTRASCVAAYSNDVAQAMLTVPELMAPAFEERQATPTFQVFVNKFVRDGEPIGDLSYSWVRKGLGTLDVSSEIPDGMLWTMDVNPAGSIVGSVLFKSNLFTADTVQKLATAFQKILVTGLADPDAPVQALSARQFRQHQHAALLARQRVGHLEQHVPARPQRAVQVALAPRQPRHPAIRLILVLAPGHNESHGHRLGVFKFCGRTQKLILPR
jgi:hypothetical protein